MNPRFWRKKRVLVTGHTGFKGAWLSLWLQQTGATVLGLALPPESRPALFDQANVEHGMVSLSVDVRDSSAVSRTMTELQPEIIFHLAAQSLVRRSYSQPLHTFETNVLGTANILDAVRKLDCVRSVVVVTSDKCYLDQGTARGYTETDPLGGFDPYSSSKAAAEIVTAAYRNSYFSETASKLATIASVRAGNVIGGGDWSDDRLVPDLIRAFSGKRAAVLRNPGAVRPWQHVLDPLAGYLCLAERLYANGHDYAEAWNFGPDAGGQISVDIVAKRIADLWGEEARLEVQDAGHPHETKVLLLDAGKARARLGWHPRLDFNATLAWTVSWYKAQSQGVDIRRVTEKQIEQYMELQ